MKKKIGKGRILFHLGVIGVIFFFAIPNFLSAPCNPYQGEAKETLGKIFKMLESYYAEKDVYTDRLNALGFQPRRADHYRYEIRLSPDKQTFEIIASSKKMTFPAIVGENDDVWTLDHDMMMTHKVYKCKRNGFYDFGLVMLYALACIAILEILFMISRRLWS